MSVVAGQAGSTATIAPGSGDAKQETQRDLYLNVEQKHICGLLRNPPDGIKIIGAAEGPTCLYVEFNGKLVARCERDGAYDPYYLYLCLTGANSPEVTELLKLDGFAGPFMEKKSENATLLKEAENVLYALREEELFFALLPSVRKGA